MSIALVREVPLYLSGGHKESYPCLQSLPVSVWNVRVEKSGKAGGPEDETCNSKSLYV